MRKKVHDAIGRSYCRRAWHLSVGIAGEVVESGEGLNLLCIQTMLLLVKFNIYICLRLSLISSSNLNRIPKLRHCATGLLIAEDIERRFTAHCIMSH